MRKSLKLLGFVFVFAFTSPLWVVGFVLAGLHWILNGAAVAVLRFGFWEPCRWGWMGMVGAWRAFHANPAVPGSERARQESAERFRRRAGRAGGRR